MIRVVLADDHVILRDGLRYLLQAAGDIQVVATASNGQEAIQQATQHCPDVMVMDISMPIMNGIEATQQIGAICKNTKVLILSMHHTSEYIQRAQQAGAQGYLLKDSAGAELITAVRALHAGESYYSKKIGGGV